MDGPGRRAAFVSIVVDRPDCVGTLIPMNNTTTTAARYIDNANRLGHGCDTVAAALTFTGIPAKSVCVWCAGEGDDFASRCRAGGDCSLCSDSGRDCLVVVASA